MPPKIDWPAEAELRAIFQRYEAAGLTGRDVQIDRFLQEHSRLNASRRSVLDLIRSFESGTGRVLETIRGRDERSKGFVPPKRAKSVDHSSHATSQGPSKSAASDQPVPKRRGRPPKRFIQGSDDADGNSSSESHPTQTSASIQKASSSLKSAANVAGTRGRDPAEEIKRLHSLIERLKEQQAAIEEEKDALNERYLRDQKSWTDKATLVEQENQMLGDDLKRHQKMTEIHESENSHRNAEVERLASDIAYWKAAAEAKDKELSELRRNASEASLELERCKSERDTLKDIIGKLKPLSIEDAPQSLARATQRVTRGSDVLTSGTSRGSHRRPSPGSDTGTPEKKPRL